MNYIKEFESSKNTNPFSFRVNKQDKDFFEKKYHVRVTHFDDCHSPIVRDFFYDDFATMKRCTEYCSKYPNCICEVIDD